MITHYVPLKAFSLQPIYLSSYTSWSLFLFAFGTSAAVHSHGIE